MRAIVATSLAAALLLGACATPERGSFHWGAYEQCVLGRCQGGGNPADEIRTLAADVEWARERGVPVGPGIHAHLGYLYHLTGNDTSAAAEFRTEKELYPESAVFMDGLLRRMST